MILTNERLFDLVRQCRGELHKENLITDEEYVALAFAGSVGPMAGSVARLEDYDQMRGKLQIRRQLGEYARHKANCQLIRADNLINHDSHCLWLITRKDCKCKKCTCGLSDLQAKLKELEGV